MFKVILSQIAVVRCTLECMPLSDRLSIPIIPTKLQKLNQQWPSTDTSENRKSHRCMPVEDAYSANRENPLIDRDFKQGRVALCQTQLTR